MKPALPPHRVRLDIIERLVKPDILKGNPKMYAREMKNLNDLFPRYPDPAFWLGINLGFQLHSLAWFKAEGAAELEAKWRYSLLIAAQPTPIPLDIPTKPESMGMDTRAALSSL